MLWRGKSARQALGRARSPYHAVLDERRFRRKRPTCQTPERDLRFIMFGSTTIQLNESIGPINNLVRSYFVGPVADRVRFRPRIFAVSGNGTTTGSRHGPNLVYRHSVLFGDAIDPAVKLDGTKIGNSIPGGFFQVQTTPGAHEVSTTTEATYATTVTVSTNVDSYIKFHVAPGALTYRVVPAVVNETNAIPEMQGLHYAR